MERYAKKSNIIYIILQLILYAAFLTVDLMNGNILISSGIKYTIIILCFCYALFTKKGIDKSILFIMKTALFFTLVADLFLLLFDLYYYGVMTFIIVQQLYGIRLSISKYHRMEERRSYIHRFDIHTSGLLNLGLDRKTIIQSFLIRIAFQVGVTVLVCYLLQYNNIIIDNLLIISIMYFVSILMNVMIAVKEAYLNPKNKSLFLFAIGMLLFLLCDINVGLFNLTGFITIPLNISSIIYTFSSILMWTFYAPSQVLISLSVRKS